MTSYCCDDVTDMIYVNSNLSSWHSLMLGHTYRFHIHSHMDLWVKNNKSTRHFGCNNEMTSCMTYGISIVDRFQRFLLSKCLSYSCMPKYTLSVVYFGYIMEKTYIFGEKNAVLAQKTGI